MTSMTYTVLPVGQGTGTLIQVIDGGEPKTSILIDFGSRLWNESVFGVQSVKTVTDALNSMTEKGPTLDAVFISHPDADHVNQIPKLLANFKKKGETDPTKKELAVKKVWYGGDYNIYAKKKQIPNVLLQLRDYGATFDTLIGAHDSDLTKPLYTSGPNGVEIFVIIGNTLMAKTDVTRNSPSPLSGDKKYLVNTHSLVLLVSYGTGTSKRHFIATGDATGLTMAACNQVLSADFTRRNQNWIAPVQSIALPHHGSFGTTYNLLNATTATTDAGDTARAVVAQFVDFLQPETVTISAGQVDGYYHPSYSVIDDFSKYISPATYNDPVLNDDEHFYTVYFEPRELNVIVKMDYSGTWPKGEKWPSGKGWRTVRTTQAVYATDYYEVDDKGWELQVPVTESSDTSDDAVFMNPDSPYSPLPPWACGWEYKVDQNGLDVELSPKYPVKYERADEDEELAAALLSRTHLAPPPKPPALIPPVPPPCPVPEREPAVVRITAQPSAALPGRRRVRAMA